MKKISILVALSTASIFSCTNLDEGIYDKQIAENFYSTPEGINSALASIYGEVRGDWGGKGIAGADRGWFDLNEVSTDECMIPTRADGAWADNGIWLQVYRHEWGAGHEFMNNTWNWLYRAVFKSNLSVELLIKANAPADRIAEAKVLRAYFYYMLMDGWGNIPFYLDNTVSVGQIPQKNRAEVYAWVVQELKDNVDLLAETKGGVYYGRFNKWAGYSLLAKVYLNAKVYVGQDKWTEAIAACDKVINNGGFSLSPNLYEGIDGGSKTATGKPVFGDRLSDDEAIMAVYVDGNLAPRNMIGIRTLRGEHGAAMFGFSTWNGATAHQNFINKYEDEDLRKAQWLVGAHPGDITYSLNVSSLTSAGVYDGARSAKYFPVTPYNGGTASNDFPVFRYADILLTKAECQVRLGQAASALTLVNQVRARAKASELTAVTLENIYDERGRELCWEGHRRQDMIRFDKFTLEHDFKPATDNKYKLFPIPVPALQTNPSLVQNPGY